MLIQAFELFLLLVIYVNGFIFFLLYRIYDFIMFLFKSPKITKMRKELEEIQDYDEWKVQAHQLDYEQGKLKWKYNPKSKLYDYQRVVSINQHINTLIDNNEVLECLHLLKSVLTRSFGGLQNQEVYNYALSGTKVAIDNFYETILKALEFLYESDLPDKYQQFRELKHFYGHSGLFLSGGGTVGFFHLGLAEILIERDLMPNVLVGASAGSMMCAFLGTRTKDECLYSIKNGLSDMDLSPFYKQKKDGILRKIIRMMKYGYFIDKQPLMEVLKTNTQNMTFQEAYERSGILINISVTDSVYDQCKILNHVTAPNVFVWSAVLASCSLPWVFSPTKILAKNSKNQIYEWSPHKNLYMDGSIGGDIPKETLAIMFNIRNFIVSQVNVHIVPFLLHKKNYHHSQTRFFFSKLWKILTGFIISEIQHRLNQLKAMKLIPQKMLLYSNMFFQSYTGNVNISPKLFIKDYIKLLEFQDSEMILDFLNRGRNTSFHHIKQIENFSKIEKALQKYINKLAEQKDYEQKDTVSVNKN